MMFLFFLVKISLWFLVKKKEFGPKKCFGCVRMRARTHAHIYVCTHASFILIIEKSSVGHFYSVSLTERFPSKEFLGRTMATLP